MIEREDELSISNGVEDRILKAMGKAVLIAQRIDGEPLNDKIRVELNEAIDLVETLIDQSMRMTLKDQGILNLRLKRLLLATKEIKKTVL